MVEDKKNWFVRHKIMTGLLVFVAFIVIITAFSGSNEPTKIEETSKDSGIVKTSNYIIEITGTDGLEFTGSIGGGANQKTVQGMVPKTFEVSDWPAVAVIQKRGTKGTLTVTIKKNDKILNTQMTDADYGVVTVSSG